VLTQSNWNAMSDRRNFNKAIIGGVLGTLGASPLTSALSAVPLDRKNSNSEKSPAELITPETQAAIDRGLNYLLRSQITTGRNRGAFAASGLQSGVATASLGGLAMMCGGHAPGFGKFGKAIDNSAQFVMNNVQDTGYISRRDLPSERMYGHGFSMLFLSQVYGMTKKAAIGDKLRKAVELTSKTQNDDGGWRYEPVKSDADLSITVCQIMGLRGARDAGIDVSDKVRTKCIEYVKRSQNTNGSFRYTLRGGHSTMAMTAAGVTSLYSAGIYEGDQVEKALKRLMASKPRSSRGGHFFYTHYYAVQAMWHAGGKYWNTWYPAIRDVLIADQADDGSWRSSEAGPQFGAAMACIILQMPLNYVPVFSP
jgi:hypothetical protein